MLLLIVFTIIFLLIFQGGFYPSAFLLVGILGILFLAFSQRRIRMTTEIAGLIIIVFIYLISAILNGFFYSILSQSMLPGVCLIVACLVCNLETGEKNKIILCIEVIGIISAVVGIVLFVGMLDIPGCVNAGRLQFTFQYANVAGTWFAVCFILARDSKNKTVRTLSPINLIALLMTKSMGAILILFVLQTIWIIRRMVKKRTRATWGIFGAYLAGAIVAGAIVMTRFEQGIYTFAERSIHTYDGLRVMASNLLLGIGAGNWQYVYPFYQSAQYKAGVIHNSYVQMGVSAGIVPMVLMIALLIIMIVRFVGNCNGVTEAALFILLHSMMDYCLSFACIDILLIVLLGVNREEKGLGWVIDKFKHGKSKDINQRKSVKVSESTGRVIRIASCFLIMGALCFGYYGTMQIRNMDRAIAAGEADKAIEIYESNNALMKNGYKEKELYVQALFQKREYKKVIETMNHEEKVSYLMETYKMLSKQNLSEVTMDELIASVNEQPFNIERVEQITKIVENGTFSENEIDKYNNNLASLNKNIKKWPACRLNNQKETDYAKKR